MQSMSTPSQEELIAQAQKLLSKGMTELSSRPEVSENIKGKATNILET